MDTSYVAVGTVMYMITDSLTCRPQEKPRRSGAPVPISNRTHVSLLLGRATARSRLTGYPKPPERGARDHRGSPLDTNAGREFQ